MNETCDADERGTDEAAPPISRSHLRPASQPPQRRAACSRITVLLDTDRELRG